MIEAIRIWDYIKDVTWMDDSHTTSITFSINLDILPVNNIREIEYVIKEIATKYGGKIYNEIDLIYGEGNILNVECTVEGCDRLEKSNAIVGKIRDSLFTVHNRDLPIDVNYIGTTPVNKGVYVVQIIIYNTIKKETCDEINELIKDFQGKEMNGDKARVHSDFEPTCINAVFKSQDAAMWFYKTIKLIEELD